MYFTTSDLLWTYRTPTDCHLQNKSLLNDKILGWSKIKVFADNKVNLNEKLKLVWEG